ncbi:MAG: aminotransferase class IV, partial [Moraxellaceae bacterium]|nr:aminotransferase class IV [Moraxellaceae bacterium]
SQLLLGTSPLLAGHKHLNRLEQVLLRRELALSPGAQEALVMDSAGHVVEGVFSNVFWVHEGVVHTPLLDQSGVKGVMRGAIMQQAAVSGMDVREGRYCLQDVQAADEVFFCNSLYGIWPVRQLGDQPLPLGPVAAMLHDYWQQLLEAA